MIQKKILEKQLQGKLDAACPAAAQNGVAQADVGCCCERINSGACAVRIESVGCSVGKEGRQQRTGKSGMIEGVVEIRPELHFQVLVDLGHFANGEVQIPVVRPEERIASLVAEMAGSRRAIRHISSADKSARDRERAEVKEICRVAIVVMDGGHNVGMAEPFAASVEVADEIVIQREWEAAEDRQHSAQGPPGPQSPH